MGGKAFDKTSPVLKEHISIIANGLYRQLSEAGCKFRAMYLGSTNKKPISGDIDIGIELHNWSYEHFHEFLKLCLGFTHVQENTSLNQIYTCVKNPEILHEEWVQVDFLIGDIGLLNFTHGAPYPLDDGEVITDENMYYKSAWSGSHRTELLKAIAKSLSWVGYEDGSPVARVGYTLHHDRGLSMSSRWHPKRKDGIGRVRKMVEVADEDMDEFRAQFPDAPECSKVVIDDPFDIVKILFPEGFDSGRVVSFELNSYEMIVKVLAGEKSLSDKLPTIWELYTARLDHIGKAHPEKSVDEFLQSIARYQRE